MQYKRPINVARTRKTGIPTYVNSFQFLRANKLVLSMKIENTVLDTIIPGRKGSFHRICCRWNSLLVIPDFGCVTHSVRRVERIFTSPLIKRSITSGSDYVRQLLDGYFLTLVPGNEFYLATPFFIGDGITVALSQINGHKIIFYVLMIG